MSDRYSLRKDATDVPYPFLIVCEGMSDVRFVCSLLEYRNITTCSVVCPSKEGLGRGSGLDSIPNCLRAIYAITKGKQTLRGILIIIDANDKPDERFTAMQKAFIDANFPAPKKPFTVEVFTADGDTFRVAIFMLPKEGENGALETILLEAALNNNPKMKTCLDNFCDCTGEVTSWTPNQQSKMRLSALVAASCQNNPWASAGIMWSEKGCPVPIESDCFTHISAFIEGFISDA